MQTQNIPAKKSFKIDELSRELGVKKFVIKNWEKQFELKKVGNDNRYSQEDFKVFAAIKNLIFVQKVPYGQVKKHLQDIIEGKYVTALTNAVCTTQEQVQEQTQEATQDQAQEFINQAQGNEPIQDLTTELEQQEQQAQAFIMQNATQEQVTSTQVQELEVAQSAQVAAAQEQIECISVSPEIKIEATTQIEEPAQTLESQEPQIAEETFVTTEEQPQTFQAAQTEVVIEPQQEFKADEIIAATATEEITEIQPAFKEKEEFFKQLRSFKEELLKIHAQLK